jgi:hypothetical protein
MAIHPPIIIQSIILGTATLHLLYAMISTLCRMRSNSGSPQVENTLFCVHRSFLERESEVFIEEFAKSPQDGPSEGPFRLERITSAEFATFLWVWYSP